LPLFRKPRPTFPPRRGHPRCSVASAVNMALIIMLALVPTRSSRGRAWRLEGIHRAHFGRRLLPE
jgi:hypothetical protein